MGILAIAEKMGSEPCNHVRSSDKIIYIGFTQKASTSRPAPVLFGCQKASFLPMKTLPFRLSILAMACACGGLQAQTTVSTAPVGFVSTNLNATSDNNLGIPLQQPAAVQTTVGSVSGNVITTSAALTANQFVYSAGVQSNTYYMLVNSSATSALNGTWYEVTANSATTLTVSPNGSNTLQASGLSTGDSISVIPFWTLNTVFPSGAGIDATTNATSLQTQILFFPQNVVGANLGASATYIYWSGGQGLANGWYNIGTGLLSNDICIPPDTYIIVRNIGAAKQITVTGTVPASGGGSLTSPISTLAANQTQDNLVVNPLPVALTLSQLNLFQSGAFAPTTNATSLQDQLLIFSPTATGYNLGDSSTLIYWTGGQGLANGWYNIGTGAGPLDSTTLISGGQGFIVRKIATSVPTTINWTVTAPY